MAIKPCDDEEIDNFTDYILNNYIDNDVALFPPNVCGGIFQRQQIEPLIAVKVFTQN